MTRPRAALAVAVAALAVAGCMGGTPIGGSEYAVRRYVDREARVVCWRADGGGIACLPCADVAPGLCDTRAEAEQ